MARAGERLRAAREARGLSLRQVARATRIPVAVLEAIERGELERLPGGIFGRGFIRAYAAEVGLDPEATLRQCLDECPAMNLAPAAIDLEADSEFESRRRAAAVAAWLLALSVPAAVAIVYLTQREPSAPARPSAVGEVAASAGRREAGSVLPHDPARGVSAAPAVADSPAVARGIATATTSPPLEASSHGDAAPVAIAIDVEPTGRCWVQVSTDGREPQARTLGAGERARYAFAESALVIVGDAARCGLRVDGRPLRPPGKPGEVRRLRLTREDYARLIQ